MTVKPARGFEALDQRDVDDYCQALRRVVQTHGDDREAWRLCKLIGGAIHADYEAAHNLLDWLDADDEQRRTMPGRVQRAQQSAAVRHEFARELSKAEKIYSKIESERLARG